MSLECLGAVGTTLDLLTPPGGWGWDGSGRDQRPINKLQSFVFVKLKSPHQVDTFVSLMNKDPAFIGYIQFECQLCKW